MLHEALSQYGLKVKSMGRDLDADPEFFTTCSAAATYAISVLDNQ